MEYIIDFSINLYYFCQINCQNHCQVNCHKKQRDMESKYPHLYFRKQWTITPEIAKLLGQCEAYVESISSTPILPERYDKLMHVALLKGAQATTAIEGNTLSDEEINKMMMGEKLAPSKEYQQIEVQNLLEALNSLLAEVVKNHFDELISVDLIKRFHLLIGKNLGEHLQAIPGDLGRMKLPLEVTDALIIEMLSHCCIN